MSRFSSLAQRSWAMAAVLVVVTIAAFWPVRSNGFVGFDDPRYITENEQVKAGLTASGVVWAFTTTHAYNWHPLTWISHMADVEAFGLDPGRHHLVSVGFHALNAVLLLFVLRGATGALWPSVFAAFVFALHPLRVESVAWASERKDVLGTMFWLLTMAAYLVYARRPSAGRYAAVVAAFAAGLAAKPMQVTLPFVLLLLDFWPLGRARLGAYEDGAKASRSHRSHRSRRLRRSPEAPGPVPWRQLILEKLPLLALSAAASAITVRAQQGIVQSAESFPIDARLANALVSCVRYLGKMVWPVELAVFYPYRARSLASPEVWAAAAALAALTVLAVALRRRGYPLVGWLWFLGTLVPVLGLVQAGIQSMADRYTYIPGIGVLVAACWGAADVVQRRRWSPAAAGALALATLATLGVLTWRQTRVWRDDESLFAHAVAVTDGSYWAHYNLGLTLLRGGRAEEAVPRFEQAVRLEPRSREARSNLGAALERTGRFEQALDAFRGAAAVDPEDPFAVRDLTRILVQVGRGREAAGILGDALRRWPRDRQLHYTLGLAHLTSELPGAAIAPLRRSVELDPSYAAAHNALGIALARSGDPASALRHFERAVEIAPDYQEARSNLARMRALDGAATGGEARVLESPRGSGP